MLHDTFQSCDRRFLTCVLLFASFISFDFHAVIRLILMSDMHTLKKRSKYDLPSGISLKVLGTPMATSAAAEGCAWPYATADGRIWAYLDNMKYSLYWERSYDKAVFYFSLKARRIFLTTRGFLLFACILWFFYVVFSYSQQKFTAGVVCEYLVHMIKNILHAFDSNPSQM